MGIARLAALGMTAALLSYGSALADDITVAGSTFVSRMTSLYQVALRGKVVETVTPKKKRVKRWFLTPLPGPSVIFTWYRPGWSSPPPERRALQAQATRRRQLVEMRKQEATRLQQTADPVARADIRARYHRPDAGIQEHLGYVLPLAPATAYADCGPAMADFPGRYGKVV